MSPSPGRRGFWPSGLEAARTLAGTVAATAEHCRRGGLVIETWASPEPTAVEMSTVIEPTDRVLGGRATLHMRRPRGHRLLPVSEGERRPHPTGWLYRWTRAPTPSAVQWSRSAPDQSGSDPTKQYLPSSLGWLQSHSSERRCTRPCAATPRRRQCDGPPTRRCLRSARSTLVGASGRWRSRTAS